MEAEKLNIGYKDFSLSQSDATGVKSQNSGCCGVLYAKSMLPPLTGFSACECRM